MIALGLTGGEDETPALIGSDRLVGATVFRLDGEMVGPIERLMLDKRSGGAAHVVVAFGGFLGFGAGYLAVPWSLLHYEDAKGGYVLAATAEQLEELTSAQTAGSLATVPGGSLA